MTDEDEILEDSEPLSAEEFRNALQAVASLGLTWTADRVPRVIAKTPEAESAFASDEYQELVSKYPELPRELSVIVYHALTGAPAFEGIVGSPETVREKVADVRNLLLTESFRAEFFFKHAIKVPYLETIDWEVVLKTHERNVVGMPIAGYALLLLIFHNTNANVSKINVHENYTVAVDLPLVIKLINVLTDVKTALEEVNDLSRHIVEAAKVQEQTDGREH